MNQTQGTDTFVTAAGTPPGFLLGLPSPFTYPHTIFGKTGFIRPFPGFYLVLGGLCGAAAGRVSWTQVLLCSARAEDFASGMDAIFSRSVLEDHYPFLIETLKSCTELIVSACSLGMCFLYSVLFNKDLVMLTVRHCVHLLAHEDSYFPLGKATEQL